MFYLHANTLPTFPSSFHTLDDNVNLDDELRDLLGSQSVVPGDQWPSGPGIMQILDVLLPPPTEPQPLGFGPPR